MKRIEQLIATDRVCNMRRGRLGAVDRMKHRIALHNVYFSIPSEPFARFGRYAQTQKASRRLERGAKRQKISIPCLFAPLSSRLLLFCVFAYLPSRLLGLK